MRLRLTVMIFCMLLWRPPGTVFALAPEDAQRKHRSAGDKEANIIVVSAGPSKMQALFDGSEGWTGGDGAGSIKLSPSKTIWMFGDSFIGSVKGGRRLQAEFINNSAAWQNLDGAADRLRFFYRKNPRGAATSLIKAEAAGQFYWPCDGQMIDRKLYLFMRRVTVPKNGGGPLDFQVLGCDLIIVSNPLSEPTEWQYRSIEMPFKQAGIDAASCCVCDKTYLYVFGRILAAKEQNQNRLAVARLSTAALQRGDYLSWQYWCETASGGAWKNSPDHLQILFPDAAPEMTIARLPGLAGWSAVYMPPFSNSIFLRRCASLTGKWSGPQVIYRCPSQAKNVILYNARAHPELSPKDGAMVITYCRNSLNNNDHSSHPELYRPQVVAVKVRPTDPGQ